MLQTELIAPVPDLLRRHAKERGAKIAYSMVESCARLIASRLNWRVEPRRRITRSIASREISSSGAGCNAIVGPVG